MSTPPKRWPQKAERHRKEAQDAARKGQELARQASREVQRNPNLARDILLDVLSLFVDIDFALKDAKGQTPDDTDA
jgi:hypothetical protein